MLLRQTLLSLILPVNLADHTAPRARGAQEGRRAVAPAVVVAAGVVAVAVSSVVIAAVAVVAAILVFAVAFLVVVAVGPDQWRVTHATDDVFHAGALGTKVLVRQPVQVEGGE